MESILFNQLTESDYGQDNDELLLQQNGITKRIKSKNFFDGAIANAMHEKYTAGRLLVADDDGNIAESEKTEADLDRAGSAVTYTEQTLTDAQKAQARSNISVDDFKTTEQQIGTWIDGKPLYRKVVDIASFGSSTTVDLSHGISNLKLITNSIIVLTSGNGTFYPLPWTRGGYAGYHINRSVITFWFSSTWTGYSGKAILEYTKTTD